MKIRTRESMEPGMLPWFFLIFVTTTTMGTTAVEGLGGEHVCLRHERYTVNVTKYVTRTITVRTYIWCVQVPPRCSHYTPKQESVPQVVEEERVRDVEKCCEGYREDTDTKLCVLDNDCPDNCYYGDCSPEGCTCHPGFQGIYCNEPCSETTWGLHCKNDCLCQRGNCDPKTGACKCPSGWTGERCEEFCPSGQHGVRCAERCVCGQYESCDRVTGICDLSPTNLTTSSNDPNIIASTTPTYAKRLDERVEVATSTVETQRKTPTLRKYHSFDVTTSKIDEDVFHALNYTTTMTTTSTTTQSSIVDEPNWTGSDHLSVAMMENMEEVKKATIGDASVDHPDDDPSTTRTNYIHLSTFAIPAAAIAVFIIIIAVLITVLLERNRRKRNGMKSGAGPRTTTTSVSVITHSTFHTSLPDMDFPIYESPDYLTPTEVTRNFDKSSVSTQIVYNMDVYGENKFDNKDSIYDHPPSRGTYRAAPLPEPPPDSVYEEVPCWDRPVNSTEIPFSTFYANTGTCRF